MPPQESCLLFFSQRDCFDSLDFFVGERELPGLEVFFHVLLVRGSGQRQHADQHREAKDDLRDSSVDSRRDGMNLGIAKHFSIGGQ